MATAKRVLRWAALLLVLATAGLLGLRWWTAPPPGSIQERAARLRAGMSIDEVAEIMDEYGRFHEDPAGAVQVLWEKGRFQVIIDFVPPQRSAVRAALLERGPQGTYKITRLFGGPPQSFLTILRRWLGL